MHCRFWHFRKRFLHYRVWYLCICISSWVISWEANYRSHVWQQPRCIVEIWLLNASVTTATNCEGNIGGSNVMKVSGAVRMKGECRAGRIYSFIIMTQWWDLARNGRTADLVCFFFFSEQIFKDCSIEPGCLGVTVCVLLGEVFLPASN